MAKKKESLTPQRGEVYLVNFDPTIGAEIRKTRPALILQNNIANRFSPVTIVAAITSHSGNSVYPTEVLVKSGEDGLGRDSVVLLNQIRTVDKGRLVRRIGSLSGGVMEHVDRAIEISLGLIEM